MSDIQNTQANNGDSFVALSADLLFFAVTTIETLRDLAKVPDASADELQTGLAMMAAVGREVGIAFAERGIKLSDEAAAALVETGNDEDHEEYKSAEPFLVG